MSDATLNDRFILTAPIPSLGLEPGDVIRFWPNERGTRVTAHREIPEAAVDALCWAMADGCGTPAPLLALCPAADPLRRGVLTLLR